MKGRYGGEGTDFVGAAFVRTHDVVNAFVRDLFADTSVTADKVATAWYENGVAYNVVSIRALELGWI